MMEKVVNSILDQFCTIVDVGSMLWWYRTVIQSEFVGLLGWTNHPGHHFIIMNVWRTYHVLTRPFWRKERGMRSRRPFTWIWEFAAHASYQPLDGLTYQIKFNRFISPSTCATACSFAHRALTGWLIGKKLNHLHDQFSGSTTLRPTHLSNCQLNLPHILIYYADHRNSYSAGGGHFTYLLLDVQACFNSLYSLPLYIIHSNYGGKFL